MGEKVAVYGIGNPLIDVTAQVEDGDISALGLNKGAMQLIDTARGNEILAHIQQHEKTYSCGGACPNTMITLAALGVRTALAGMVAKDELGRIYNERLQEQRVISDLAVHPGDTGSCIVLVTPDHERTMSTRLGVCQEFSVENVKHEQIKAADFFYFTGYMWDTESQKSALTAAIKTARAAGTKVVFDVADPFAVDRHRDEFLELLSGQVDVVLANREEARLLLEYDDPRRAAIDLAGRCETAAVKNGADGSYIGSSDGSCIELGAYRVDAVDSNGAGDNYSAGFLYGMANGYSLADSGRIAAYVAAQIVKRIGAQFDEAEATELREAVSKGLWREVAEATK